MNAFAVAYQLCLLVFPPPLASKVLAILFTHENSGIIYFTT